MAKRFMLALFTALVLVGPVVRAVDNDQSGPGETVSCADDNGCAGAAQGCSWWEWLFWPFGC